jgi:hypothetical protein
MNNLNDFFYGFGFTVGVIGGHVAVVLGIALMLGRL